MKKYILAFAAVAVLFAACSKENPANENSDVTVNSSAKVYTLSAVMPETKATINESGGKFEWAKGDKIAVYDNAQGKYQVFTTHGSGSTAEFSFSASDGLAHDFTGSAAYYPASRLQYGDIEDAPYVMKSAGDVPLTATNNSGSLQFSYEAAVVKITVNNMPSFGGSVQFQTYDSGLHIDQNLEAEFTHSETEDMDFYFAIRACSRATVQVILWDSDGNCMIDKGQFDLHHAPSVGDFVRLKTTVGPFMLFNDPDNRAKYVKLISNSGTYNDFAELTDLGNGQKYRIVPSNNWTKTGNQVTVELYGSDTSAGAFTSSKVFLYRNFEFTVGESTLSSSYRIYIEKNKTGESQFNYSDCWAFLENKDNSSDQPLGTWGGTKMNKLNDNIFYVDVPATAYGKKYYLSSHVNQNTSGDWHPKTYDEHRLKITMNRDIKTTIYAWSDGYHLSFGNTWDTTWDWN